MNGLMLLKSADPKQPVDLKDIAKGSEGDIKVDFKDFLSNLLVKIDPKDEKIDIKSTQPSKKSEKKDEKKLPLDSSTLEKDILIDDLLKFVNFLKSDGKSGHFPTDSKKLTEILQNKEAVTEFKSVKTLKELLGVAKKYDIEVKKFEIVKEDNKANNTNLKNQFEIAKKDKKDNLDILSIKNIDTKDIKLDELSVKSNKKLTPSNEKMIFDIKLKNDNNKSVKEEKSDILSKLISKKEDDKEGVAAKQVKTDINLMHKNIDKHTNDKPAIQTEAKTVFNDSKEGKIEPAILKEKTINKQEKIIRKDKDSIHIQKADTKEMETKEAKITPKSTVNIERTALNDKTPQIDIKKEVNKKEIKTKTVDKEISKTEQKEKPTEQPVEKKEAEHTVKNSLSSTQELKAKQSISSQRPITQTLNSFADDLRERIENYKPPVMKIKMTLNPKDLGSVDVTMINRGNTLQVNINSNSNTMAIFTQNQAEFKNSLVNMGFTNLSMNFSSNGSGQGENHHKNRNKSQESFEESIEQINEDTQSIELIIPRYI